MRNTSAYKQVRITLTEERDWANPGRSVVSVRILVKPLLAKWTEKCTVLAVSKRNQAPLDDMSQVYASLLELLAEQPLPRVAT